MYAAYCLAMTDRSMLEYPQQALPVLGGSGSSSGRGAAAPGSALAAAPLAGSEAGAAQAGGAGGGGEVQAGKRGWKGWGSKVHTMKRKLGRKVEDRPGTDSRGGSPPPGLADQQAAPGSASAAGGGVGVPAASGGGLAAAELESLEGFIDAKWMQSRRVQVRACPASGGADRHCPAGPRGRRLRSGPHFVRDCVAKGWVVWRMCLGGVCSCATALWWCSPAWCLRLQTLQPAAALPHGKPVALWPVSSLQHPSFSAGLTMPLPLCLCLCSIAPPCRCRQQSPRQLSAPARAPRRPPLEPSPTPPLRPNVPTAQPRPRAAAAWDWAAAAAWQAGRARNPSTLARFMAAAASAAAGSSHLRWVPAAPRAGQR